MPAGRIGLERTLSHRVAMPRICRSTDYGVGGCIGAWSDEAKQSDCHNDSSHL